MQVQKGMARFLYPLLVLTMGLSVACGDDPAPVVAPGIQPEIVNSVDNFQFQVTAVRNYTGTLNYTWSNTGTAADVNQSCAISAGVATLVLLDDLGNEVYSRDLSQDGSFVTSVGTAGSWRIRVIMSRASGTLNFRSDMRP